MIYYKFFSVIDRLASCNGTFDNEIKKIVSEGLIDVADVPLIVLYAKMRRLSDKLNDTSEVVHLLD